MSGTIHGETFDEFNARISANRKAAILACGDPVKRKELVEWDKRYDAQYQAVWKMAEASAERMQREYQLREEGYWETGKDVTPSRTDYAHHSTYRVINGSAW